MKILLCSYVTLSYMFYLVLKTYTIESLIENIKYVDIKIPKFNLNVRFLERSPYIYLPEYWTIVTYFINNKKNCSHSPILTRIYFCLLIVLCIKKSGKPPFSLSLCPLFSINIFEMVVFHVFKTQMTAWASVTSVFLL